VTDARTELARERMIDAAERLVAQRGLAAVSLRDVQAAAGQRNKSAAAYHFGSREGLLEAVLTTRMAAVSERRSVLLAAASSVRDLVDALVRPVAEHALLRRHSHWARFLHQCSADPAVGAIVRRSVEGESYREVRRRLIAAIDHLPEPLRARRVDLAFAVAVSSLASSESGRRRLTTEAEIDDLVEVCTAVVCARAKMGS
jgi:AcrR family transcriptional regulator